LEIEQVMLMYSSTHHRRRIFPRLAFGLCALGLGGFASAEATADATDHSVVIEQKPLDEVTVIGKMDKRTLDRVVNQFVQSHAKPSPIISQIGRWHDKVCPRVTGLQPNFNEFVERQIKRNARAVGAPAPADGKTCKTNVEVVFTPEPQGLVDHIATHYRPLLGYYPKNEAAQATQFTHPVQAWYLTGTRAEGGYQPPAEASGADNSGGPPPFQSELVIDSPSSAGDTGVGAGPSGTAGSRLGHELKTEFVHVLIIADSAKVKTYSLQTLSDYVSLLVLTHISTLDSCSSLPSILNLFAGDCATTPTEVTITDTTYLKALYSTNLDKNMNIEKGEIRDKMVAAMQTH
jgi:hypothetical protein